MAQQRNVGVCGYTAVLQYIQFVSKVHLHPNTVAQSQYQTTLLVLEWHSVGACAPKYSGAIPVMDICYGSHCGFIDKIKNTVGVGKP